MKLRSRSPSGQVASREYPNSMSLLFKLNQPTVSHRLDTVGCAAFSYDFDCLSGGPHALAESMDGLTNNENKTSSFYMRALFWIFPAILSIGDKGEMIRKSKLELGNIASKMWRDAKVAGDLNGKNLMSIICKRDRKSSSFPTQLQTVRNEAKFPTHKMNEEELVAQMRTTISAAFEPVSAIIAVRVIPCHIYPSDC